MPSIAIDSARDSASSDCPACATALQRLQGTSAMARVRGVHVADIDIVCRSPGSLIWYLNSSLRTYDLSATKQIRDEEDC